MPKGVYQRKPITEEHRNNLRKSQTGELNPSYKHGLSGTKEYKKLKCQKSKALSRCKGELSTSTIQMVYEDNIKKYGKLTCYLCFIPIEFGKDSLEHKIPIIRGGTHIYENLGIAHIICNNRKRNKTEQEYRDSLKQEIA